jgi:hypothetical protein
MYIILETIPQDGDDYINIEITKGDSTYHRSFETECNIYVKETWKDVYYYLRKFDITLVEPNENNIQIDCHVFSKEYNIREW